MSKRPTGARKHVHKYMLRDIGRTKPYLVYSCRGGNCTHYLPAAEAVGLDTVCWRCGQTCPVQPMRRERWVVRPHCIDCTKTYKNRLPTPSSKPVDLRKLASMSLDELLGDDDMFNPDRKKEH